MAKNALVKMTIGQLKAEIARRQKNLSRLRKKRAGLVKQLDGIDKEIAETAGKAEKKPVKKKPAKKKATRAKNKMSLVEALAGVLKGKSGVAINEAVAGVLAAGYKSTSKEFKLIVNQTLSKNPVFRKVSRGVYALQEGKRKAAGKKAKKVAKKKVRKTAKKKMAKGTGKKK